MSHGAKTDLGGIRDVSVSITSNNNNTTYSDDKTSSGIYGRMRYESGVHRVQRVPVNDGTF